MEESFMKTVLSLYQEKNWREILELNKESKNQIALKLLWVWPSLENLQFIKHALINFKLDGVLSLGCGCGLFEWLLQTYTNLPVLGYEVNREWWDSKYSDPLFIPHIYPQFPLESNCLSPNYALLFCYFNDGAAFIDYVDNYKGDVIFIIGPGNGRGTHTEPEPFNPKFGQSKWILHDSQEVKNTKDFIAIYTRATYATQISDMNSEYENAIY